MLNSLEYIMLVSMKLTFYCYLSSACDMTAWGSKETWGATPTKRRDNSEMQNNRSLKLDIVIYPILRTLQQLILNVTIPSL